MIKFDNEATLITETIEAVLNDETPKDNILKTIEILLKRMEFTQKQKIGGKSILEKYFN